MTALDIMGRERERQEAEMRKHRPQQDDEGRVMGGGG
jgi:hypothetical protein